MKKLSILLLCSFLLALAPACKGKKKAETPKAKTEEMTETKTVKEMASLELDAQGKDDEDIVF
ncbi:MAG: hypothetical protein UR26_C0003G0080 [candidate division TM6 bacterium GW2011_GWF2_32_72]|nr:MAG: hypothetical protein UR26_C0003G0080 [candidate division TM6 bacterium GW2011_GWF2_32_72]